MVNETNPRDPCIRRRSIQNSAPNYERIASAADRIALLSNSHLTDHVNLTDITGYRVGQSVVQRAHVSTEVNSKPVSQSLPSALVLPSTYEDAMASRVGQLIQATTQQTASILNFMQSSLQFRRDIAGKVKIRTVMTCKDEIGRLNVIPVVSNLLHSALRADNFGSVIASQALRDVFLINNIVARGSTSVTENLTEFRGHSQQQYNPIAPADNLVNNPRSSFPSIVVPEWLPSTSTNTNATIGAANI